MSKKSHKDSFQRMNFLYQVSSLMLNTNQNVSTYYSHLMLNIAKKSVLRIDQSIKRTICKGCHSLLEPGKTSRVRCKKKNQQITVCCLLCGTIKRYHCKRGHKTWSETESCSDKSPIDKKLTELIIDKPDLSIVKLNKEVDM